MDIVSYRGPGMAGGVSGALSRVWEDLSETDSTWWHMNEQVLQAKAAESSRSVMKLPDELVQGHYRFCNEFLWPIMHDLPEFAYYRIGDYRHYRQLNALIADQLELSVEEQAAGEKRWFFIQDYQLGLLPSLLASNMRISLAVFWHIPWPKTVLDRHLPPLLELARSLLHSSIIGFHTREYAHNFLRFVETNLVGYVVDYRNLTISPTDRVFLGFNTNFRSRGGLASYFANGQTQLLVAPLGLDLSHWQVLKTAEEQPFEDVRLQKLRDNRQFILSVDRADYTKGVLQRLQSIDRFFERFPERRGKITFAQVCGRTRNGLNSFDLYWQKCRDLADKLSQRWQDKNWSPLVWVDSSLNPDRLAQLYKAASVMLVNPLKDGLNLTAKEYVACQMKGHSGVLALSPGAGAWHELGDFSVLVDPLDANQLADSIERALEMEASERSMRIELMREKLQSNTIEHWWQRFKSAMEKRPSRIV